MRRMVHLFSKTGAAGRSKGAAKANILAWGDSLLEKLIEKDLFDALVDDVELLDALVRAAQPLKRNLPQERGDWGAAPKAKPSPKRRLGS